LNFSLYIAKRYLISPTSNNAINIITRIASVGITVSAMALFVVLSVFSGLKEYSLSFTNALHPDLKILPKNGKTFLVSPEQKKALLSLNGIVHISNTVEEKALLYFNDKEIIATLIGTDSSYTHINGIKDYLYMGEWFAPKSPQVVIGYGIAHQLAIGVYDYTNVFQLYVPKPGKGSISNPENAFNKSNVVPSGIYSLNNDAEDDKYIFAPIELAQELLALTPNEVSSLQLKILPTTSEKTLRKEIALLFNHNVVIKNKMELNDALYKMLNTEHLAVYLIFTLVIIIALFNLIGALIMMIIEKKHNLITLYNLGVSVNKLRNIFLYQGLLLSFISGSIGIVIGVAIVLIQKQFDLIMITQSMPYPVQFYYTNIGLVFITLLILGFLSSVIASKTVSKKFLRP
jgi:lipoprotein-releasing system permease protein